MSRKQESVHLGKADSMGGRILVIGISVRALVESAVRGNHSVMALDAFGDQDLKALAESYALPRDFQRPYGPRSLFDASRGLKFDSVVYTSNLENHPEVLDLFAADRRIIGNSPQTVRSVRNWRDLFSRLQGAGFRVPATLFPSSDLEIDRNQKWLVKPMLSGGGHGIHFFQGRPFESRRWLLQQFIPGKACSASFVANGDRAVLFGIAEQLIGAEPFGAQDFSYCGSILPLPEVLDPEKGGTIIDQARQIAAFLTRTYGLTGVNGFDFILEGSQVWLTEVNPRYSASMELAEAAYGLPLFPLHVQSALEGQLPRFELETQLNLGRFFGKSILYCSKNTTVTGTLSGPGLDIRDIPNAGERLREGSPICTILANRESYEATYADLVRQSIELKEQIDG